MAKPGFKRMPHKLISVAAPEGAAGGSFLTRARKTPRFIYNGNNLYVQLE